jgi:3-methylfumaryl-CoA hydratase
MSGAYDAWVGRTETVADVAAPGPVARLAALLDHQTPPWREGEAPPLSHWLYFLPQARQSELGEDGHPRRGGFLPPVQLPRRMWAGSRVEFLNPVRFGAELERRSTIRSVTEKSGASGEMVFVTVRHEVHADGLLCLTDEQDIVYRGASAPAATPAPEAVALPSGRIVVPDPVMLFRYSALTFNGHRIHYDRDYATVEEGYPGLVVHGPLTATLLMDAYLRERPGVEVARFSFRGRRPLFDGSPITLVVAHDGGKAALSAYDADGAVCVSAEIESR